MRLERSYEHRPYGKLIPISLLALAILTSCVPQQPQLDEPVAAPAPDPAVIEPVIVEEPVGPIKVGLLLPLSGPTAALGQDMLSAAQMALFDLPPHDVVLLPRDTGGNPAGAESAAWDLIDAGAEVILGPLLSTSTIAAKRAASLNGVTLISFSSNAAIAGDGVYVMGFRPEEQVERIVNYAISQGHPRVAMLAPDNGYGAVALDGYRAALRTSAANTNGRYALYPGDAGDQSDAVRRVSDFAARAAIVDKQRTELEKRDDANAKAALKALEGIDTQTPPPFDAVVIADGGNRLRSVGALLAFFDVTQPETQMLGTMAWLDDPKVMAEPNLNSGWVATVDPAMRQTFDELFERRLGSRPNLLAQLAYDAVALAVLIGTEDRSYPAGLITDPEGFAGSSGIFRFTANGLGEHGLAVIEVARDGSRTEIEPAPTAFQDSLVQGF